MMQPISLLVLTSALFFKGVLASRDIDIDATGEVQPHSPELESIPGDATSLVQANLLTVVSERSAARARVRFFLGRGLQAPAAPAAAPAPAAPPAPPAPAAPPAQALIVPTAKDSISPLFWKKAEKVINSAGLSTPLPSAALANAPPPPGTPGPWETVLNDAGQPIDTKLGGYVMEHIAGKGTPTPPPTQDRIDQQFVAQCPMVLFNRNLSVRAPSCNNTRGRWIDPSPLNQRSVLRWEAQGNGNLRLGVDSQMSGRGAALFAEIKQDLTFNTYKFKMTNCLGVDRWEIEEMVYKVDSVGHVSSTMELHDVSTNSVAYFYKYLVRKASGELVAQSSLYRMGTRQVNFTEYKNGMDTGKVMAIATKRGEWTKKEWRACMSPTSPRAWDLYFPPDHDATALVSAPNSSANATKKTNTGLSHATQATVQDIRVAFTGTITLMAHRNEQRGKDGLTTEGNDQQLAMFLGGIALIVVLLILVLNCCMVFRVSGLSQKLRKTLFDSEGALLPKHPSQHRSPPFNPSY